MDASDLVDSICGVNPILLARVPTFGYVLDDDIERIFIVFGFPFPGKTGGHTGQADFFFLRLLQGTEILKPVDDAKLIPGDIAARVAGSRVVGLRGKELIKLHAGMHVCLVIEQVVYKIEVLIAATHAHLGTQIEFFGLDSRFLKLIKSLLKAVSVESGRANLLLGVIEQICLVTAFENPIHLTARARQVELFTCVVKSSDAGASGQVVSQSVRLVDKQDVIPIVFGDIAGAQDVAGL